MSNPKKIVIIAGEESGDQHAALLVQSLLEHNNNVSITGIGGQHMQKAGVTLISDLAKFGVTGLIEVLKHARVIKNAFTAIKAHLILTKPDLLILVDYPGFNLRLAKFAKLTLGLKIIYYISPQIWAWKANRIHTIRQCIDHMAVIFPFEKKIYEQAGVRVSFVGHPLLKQCTPVQDPISLRTSFGLPLNKRLVALLPGSRNHEIEKHLPIMLQSAEQLSVLFPDVHFVLPIAKTIPENKISAYFKKSPLPISFIHQHAQQIVGLSECVIVASGTASLECALLGTPMCIIYKASLITYIAAMKLIKVKYLGLCNLLQGRMIVPELLQYDCNPQELTLVMSNLLANASARLQMQERLLQLKQSLSAEQADESLLQVVLRFLK